jgi:uncharacterized protein YidB (DUF937 family)
MGFLDDVLKQSGGLSGVAEVVAKNPQIVSAIVSMLSTRDTSVGGSGGLGGLVSAFQQKGLGDVMSSWISTGPNPPVSADQLKDVLGSDVLGQFASKAGVPHSQAGSILASLLPAVVDHLTPNGQVPETNALEGALGGLLSGFMKR